MKPELPDDLAYRAQRWDTLTRLERSELGRSLRILGWTYSEIRQVIPVPKSTLSYWCRDIELTEEQVADILERTDSRAGIPRDTQRSRRQAIDKIRREAENAVKGLIVEPLWLAGTVLYWGEGAKTKSMLAVANTDPRLLRLFVHWVRAFHDPHAGFVLSLHLHAGNDERAAKRYWTEQLPIEKPAFYKTFIKPPGSGHRKNRHEHGVCRVLMRKSTDAWHRTMAWIEMVESSIDLSTYCS